MLLRVGSVVNPLEKCKYIPWPIEVLSERGLTACVHPLIDFDAEELGFSSFSGGSQYDFASGKISVRWVAFYTSDSAAID